MPNPQQDIIMEKIFSFLDKHIEVALATVENDRPRIRVFQIMARTAHTLYFATSPTKQVYRQLRANPNIEIMASADNIFVRVAGRADFTVDDAMQRNIFLNNPVLPRLYSDYKALVYFKIEAQEMEYFDLTPTPPISAYYDLRNTP